MGEILEQHRVNIFIKRRALIHKYKADDERETEFFRNALLAGDICPIGGQKVLELNTSESPAVGWKEMFEKHLIKYRYRKYGPKTAAAKAVQYMEKLQADCEKKMVIRVVSKDNPKWEETKKVSAA